MTDYNGLMVIEGLHLGPRDQVYANMVPGHLRDGIKRYVEHGLLPGSFLQAVISNRLWDTLCRADDDLSKDDIKAVYRWFYECAPAECFGSIEKLQRWETKGGLKGRDAA